MRITIIEDEKLTAEDLAETILKTEPAAQITAILPSVKESIAYFRENEMPDLIFSDIQLGDGLSFDIFREVAIQVPVIFCTAYDEYALSAFQANGIAYILKPFTQKTVSGALQKYRLLKDNLSKSQPAYQLISDLFRSRQDNDRSVLVYIRDKILPVRINDVAVFFLENEVIHLFTFQQKSYYINKSVDDIQKLAGSGFYRINRQCLVNRKAIVDAMNYSHRKLVVNLNVPFPHPLTVSKLKVPEFLQWLSGN